MPPHRAHLSVITRLPQPGLSKTRLIPELGAAGAAELQRAMTEHVVRQGRIARATAPVTLDVRLADGSPRQARRWLGVPATLQCDGDLGASLEQALEDGLARADVAAVLGGDCPTVDAADIRDALAAAGRCGAALIPATDGGFCLLALARGTLARTRGLLDGVEWGSERACADTVARLRLAGVEPALLPVRSDVDTAADLPAWERVRAAWYDPPRSLAAVVPALNEAAALPRLLAALVDGDTDVIVVDGGSTDGTPELARGLGARVITAPSGRASQMNAGAAATSAHALLFCHADSVPPDDARGAVLRALADPGVALGAFAFALEGADVRYRVLETGTGLRGRVLGLPYGDQGLHVRSVMFRALGGFPDLPVMEDYEFVRRARRAGRVVIGSEPLVTSDRRWRALGAWRCTWLNLATVARYHLGTPPEELARWRAGHSKR